MRLLEINTVCGRGSTGRIAVDIAERAKKDGYEVCVAYGRGQTDYPDSYRIGDDFDNHMHAALSRITDKQGCYSRKATNEFIKFIEEYKPDIVHLHNIHGYYLNYEILFKYLAQKKSPVVWTFHDCWPFTGHCVYFDLAHCNKWETECNSCPLKRAYPSCYVMDHSRENFLLKKKLFSSIDNLYIVTCSSWLEGLVRRSFLSDKNIRTIHNGIDLGKFKRSESTSFRQKYSIEDKKILLGVADGFDEQKGLFEYIELSNHLSEDYVIVLVGCEIKLSEKGNIITIPRTKNIDELIEIYSSADMFLNLTLNDNFPTVNLEALACGLPVVTYDTGGSPESIDASCGIVVDQHDISGLLIAIPKAINIPQRNCLEKAKCFDRTYSFNGYVDLYNEILNDRGKIYEKDYIGRK